MNAGIGTGTAMGTIVNDDAQPAVSVDDIARPEGNTGMTTFRFTLTLSAPSGAPVKVVWATANGTATSPADYLGTFGNVVFPAGVVSKVVVVNVVGDKTAEPREQFVFNIIDVANGTIGDGQGTATVRNDD
jgi:hypothetical protein